MEQIYVILDRATGKELARGPSIQCARRMKMTYGSFLTMVSRSRKGKTRYIISAEPAEGETAAAIRRWDDAFSGYRLALAVYPCTGCMRRAICDYTGQCCPAWRRWFTAHYDYTARRIRTAQKED